MRDVERKGIYTDLMRKFRDEGHQVYVVTPCERREGKSTARFKSAGINILRVKTLNVQKTNVIEKGIGQISLEFLFKMALKKYFKQVKFDIILYSTPPISFTNVIKYVKKRNPQVKTYLMLKDIFPQNAVDLGMLTKSGIKGFFYNSFRKKEKELYRISDYIGCMSPANVKYLLKHNIEIDPRKVEICPNSYERINDKKIVIAEEQKKIRKKYNLPVNKPIFIYGGNLGKPQGIPFLIECLNANKDREDCHFVVVGDGFESPRLEKWYNSNKPKAVSVFKRLYKEDYDKLTNACDVGLIFLDHRFTIPNYPSRLLPYLMERKPIIACTDPNCDTGTLAEENGYGYFCESNDVASFTAKVKDMLKTDRKQMGENGYQFYLKNYTVDNSYQAIMNHFTS